MEDRFAAHRRLTRVVRRIWRALSGAPLPALLVSGLISVGVVACGSSSKRSTEASVGASSPSAAVGPSKASSSRPAKDATSNAGSDQSSGAGHAAAPRGSASAPASTLGATPPGDQDGDSPNDKAFDKDDSFVTTFGHPASPADKASITALVTRYYAAIAKADGATACKLLFFVFVESAPETYGQTAFDATAGRGKSCAAVMSKVFTGNHQELVAENRHLKVIGIRILRKRAWVLLRFGPLSVRRLIVYREGSTWKVGEVLDTGLV